MAGGALTIDLLELFERRWLDDIQYVDDLDKVSAQLGPLRAATSEAGAGLDSLDQEVTDWLAAQDLGRSFVIRAR